MFRLLLKIVWKKGIPIPTGYIMEKMCYTKIMEYDFKSELKDELGRLIRTHREVIKVLGG